MIAPLACVIPAFNASATLPAVVAALRVAVPHARVLVVDDGSADETHAVARRVSDAAIRLNTNRGKGAALRAGIAAALLDDPAAVLTLDADGQHDPGAAPRLLAALTEADLAVGTRARGGTAMPLRRRLTNVLASAAVGVVSGARVPDSQSGYRAMRRQLLEQVSGRGDRYEYETDFLIRAVRAGYRIAWVPVPTVYGARSHFRSVSDTVRIASTIWHHRARGFT